MFLIPFLLKEDFDVEKSISALQVLQKLLDAGANVDVKDGEEKIPLIMASE